MDLLFLIFSVATLVAAVAAMSLRNLVHCALCLALTFAGLAVLYLKLDAQFVGFAQILVYVGAVAILVVFAILLTRGTEPVDKPAWSASWAPGVGIATVVFAVLSIAVFKGDLSALPHSTDTTATAAVTVQHLGMKLMSDYVLPLETIALLLTAALIGAVIIAMDERKPQKP
jgi:NADH:ubiquinone oxidoreductase subunit 6 (subunit J)